AASARHIGPRCGLWENIRASCRRKTNGDMPPRGQVASPRSENKREKHRCRNGANAPEFCGRTIPTIRAEIRVQFLKHSWLGLNGPLIVDVIWMVANHRRN